MTVLCPNCHAPRPTARTGKSSDTSSQLQHAASTRRDSASAWQEAPVFKVARAGCARRERHSGPFCEASPQARALDVGTRPDSMPTRALCCAVRTLGSRTSRERSCRPFLEPVLPQGPGRWYEPRFAGHRTVLVHTEDTATLYARSGRPRRHLALDGPGHGRHGTAPGDGPRRPWRWSAGRSPGLAAGQSWVTWSPTGTSGLSPRAVP